MNRYTILIVDDDQLQHEVLGDYLGLAGFRILHAQNGVEALNILESDKAEIVLLDIQMPVMDGFKTLQEMRKRSHLEDIPVIIVTCLNQQYLKIKGLELGADDYITKPFNSAELLARINAVLRRTQRYQRSEGVMNGDLADINLVELMQNMEAGVKTAVIHLKNVNGDIFIEKGQIIFVRYGDFTGEQALYRLFLLEKGVFSVDFDALPAKITKNPRPITKMLMNVLAYVDEIEDSLKHIKGKNSPLQFASDLSDFPSMEKLKKLPTVTFFDMLIMMEGDLKENLKVLIAATKKGKLKALR
ncbi:response regulator [Desulfococcaceae bacterium HSG9]|nr:response regulator [Desulfococcaceae bacterium HSG9]